MSRADLKEALFEQFALVAKSLASAKRMDLLDVLSQGERTVEALAHATGLKLTTASAHLQTLRHGGLVTSRKDGTRIYYRLAGDDVARLYVCIREVGRRHLAETERAARDFLGEDGLEPVGREELCDRIRSGAVFLVDVRPEEEFAAAHIEGAVSVPLADLADKVRELPSELEVVAYCRGEYCVLAYDAVRLLRAKGLRARRMAGGMLEWRIEGRPTAQKSALGAYDSHPAFHGLPEVLAMATPAAQLPRLTSLSPGAGCACKLPLAKLEQLFSSLGDVAPASGDLLVGALEGDDAAVLRLDGGQALVLTTDFFTPIVDDPGDWGRIAAVNAMSDVYAMGGRPVIAVNLAAWPGDGLPLTILADVLRGAAEAASEAGCIVAGGHTIDDPVPKYGMAVVGMADPARLMTIDRAAPGDRLILTKPLGTGVVTTALKRSGAASSLLGSALRAAVASMTLLNASASEAALAAGVRAATDVTGFGLLGHLHRMLSASGVAAEVAAGRVPMLPGAEDLTRQGFVSGGTRANLDRLSSAVTVDEGIPEEAVVLLHDAQTSGGLLLSAEASVADPLLEDLTGRGLPACEIGQVVEGPAGRIAVKAQETAMP